jgi:hypothetical protein
MTDADKKRLEDALHRVNKQSQDDQRARGGRG